MNLVYHGVRAPVRWAFRLFADLRVEGLHHVPSSGPFFLLPNHQSVLDPLLIQSICPRKIHSMTKSTQFGHPVFRTFLAGMGAFPVRRYRVDPQAVRVLLRLLDEGKGVCVYPEGERSWDGALQPFRRGTLRVALRAGVPLIPVGVSGTYDLMPRWLKRPRPGVAVRLRFGEPIRLTAIRDRGVRERRLPDFERRIMGEISRLASVPVSREALDRLASSSGAHSRGGGSH